jgi:iron(II)-dependent oxidoreductase
MIREGDFSPSQKTRLPSDPLAQALQQNRLGQIVSNRDQWGKHPQLNRLFEAAVRAVDERYALVPEGLVSIALTIVDEPGQPEVDVETKPFLMARHTVSNSDFQHFVDAGGYENMELWPEEIWPHLIDFKDQTGHSAPRYWRNGRHDRRLARHPVVGVSFYEAAAYARWAGVELPNEARWQMAASWRVRSAAHVDRRYPWGDALDLNGCNIWASGHGGTLPVDACRAGAAPNGVLQLVGNVWEWTNSDFHAVDRGERPVVGNTVMKSVRGGAYDTYFAWQATSTFRTGLEGLSRVHNVGFRCCMDMLGH